jgi:hypothetical protein
LTEIASLTYTINYQCGQLGPINARFSGFADKIDYYIGVGDAGKVNQYLQYARSERLDLRNRLATIEANITHRDSLVSGVASRYSTRFRDHTKLPGNLGFALDITRTFANDPR